MWPQKSSSGLSSTQQTAITEPVVKMDGERSPRRVRVTMVSSISMEDDQRLSDDEQKPGRSGGHTRLYEERWEEMFDKLKEFKARYGHCNVRQRYKNSQLGHWVNSMRGRKKAGELSEERIRKLEELGFIWQYRKEAWLNSYEELAKFKETYGHCNVPTSWEQVNFRTPFPFFFFFLLFFDSTLLPLFFFCFS